MKPTVMEPDEILETFERALPLVVRLMRSHRGDPVKPLVIEAKIRLEQSAMLLQQFRDTEKDFGRMKDARGTSFGSLTNRLRLYGEAFYSFSWRAHKALDACGVRFTPKGVRWVRNNMIEHPNRRGGILVMSWMFDCPEGLVLQPAGPNTPGSDPGLYPNAQEFIEKLLPTLEAEISKLSS